MVASAPIAIDALVRPRQDGPIVAGQSGRFLLDVPDGLQQGRGAWGGVATGAMASAATMVDTRAGMAVRNLTAQLVAPLLVGTAQLEVRSLRAGSATNTLLVALLDNSGNQLAQGVVVLGLARRGPEMPDGPAWLGVQPPAELAQDPEAVPVVAVGPPLAPDFATHLEFRPVLGLPFSGSVSLETTGWIRPRAAVAVVDAALVTAMADAWWVAVMPVMRAPRPAATVGFTLDLPSDPALVRIESSGRLEPLFHRGRVIAARDGYTCETRELWTRRGELLSWNTQTVAVIK